VKWICKTCAAMRGLLIPPEREVTWHEGLCESCRTRQSVIDVLRYSHHAAPNLPEDRGTKA